MSPSISLLVVFLLILLHASFIACNNVPITYQDCFLTMLNITQRCGNDNHHFTTTINYHTSFSAQFTRHIMKSLLQAIYANRRFTYVKTPRAWEHNCPAGLGWACYFSFATCPDAAVEPKDMDFSHRPANGRIEDPASAYFDREEVDKYLFNQMYYYNIRWQIDSFFKTKNLIEKGICDNFTTSEVPSITVPNLGGPIAQWLFQLTPDTTQTIQRINQRYAHLTGKPYASLTLHVNSTSMLSSSSASMEYSLLMSNASFVAERVLASIHNYTKSHRLPENHVHDIFMSKLLFFFCLSLMNFN